MRKLLTGIAAAAALACAVFVAGPAQAATNGTHTQSYACTTNTATITVQVNYTSYGLGDAGADNYAGVNWVSWTTSPSADFDRFSLYGLDNVNGGDDFMGAEGGSVATQNDVSSSGSDHAFGVGQGGTNYDWPNGQTPHFELFCWGGVGNDGSSGNVTHALL